MQSTEVWGLGMPCTGYTVLDVGVQGLGVQNIWVQDLECQKGPPTLTPSRASQKHQWRRTLTAAKMGPRQCQALGWAPRGQRHR